jgi:cbb3-type cytochrome oxidase maturation protein
LRGPWSKSVNAAIAVGERAAHAQRRSASVNVLVYLVPLALALGGLGLAAFLWAMKTGQFGDLEGAAWRAIADGDLPEEGGKE